MASAISKIDSKGRISIPIGLRVNLGLLEGNKVKIVLEKNRLVITPDSNGQSCVKVSTGVCGTLRSGSSPDSDPKRGVKYER